MAKYTSKLNLKKPEANDFYNVEDSNGNFDKIDEFASRTDNPHSVTKAQVGLGNVDNTSDMNKPVSTAQATAIAEAKNAGTNAQININGHINNKSNPHNTTADLVKAPKMLTYSETNSFNTLLDVCNSLKYGGGFVVSSFSPIYNASDYPEKGYEFVFNVITEANEARKAVIAYKYHGGKLNVYQRNIFNGSWETNWKSTNEAYYGEHNLPYPSQIQTGSYVGNGTYGSENPCRITLNFKPKIVHIAYYNEESGEGYYRTTLYYDVPYSMTLRDYIGSRNHGVNRVTWGNNYVEWYTTSTGSDALPEQLNISGKTYHYIAIG